MQTASAVVLGAVFLASGCPQDPRSFLASTLPAFWVHRRSSFR